MSQSVVHRKRAVCASVADVDAVGVDAGPVQPGPVVGEVASDRADQHRP